MATQTVLLVDDHPGWGDLLRDSLTMSGSNLVVQGCVETIRAALAAIEKQPPTLAVIDVQLSDGSGLDLCRRLRQEGSPVRMLILTGHDVDAYLAGAWAAGAVGFILKTEPRSAILEAIRRAARGETLWEHYQLLRARHWQEVAGDKWAALTDEEQATVIALVHMKTDAEIADELDISSEAVKQHLTDLYRKLGVTDRREIARWAVIHRLVTW